jgi:hypothetical protein
VSEQQQPYLKKYAFYPKLRKWTVPVHWAMGLFCAFAASQFVPAGLFLLCLFAFMEWWNDKEEKARNPAYLPSGCADWWDSFVTFCPGFGVDLLLNALHIITLRWWV